MNVSVKGRGIEVTDGMRDYAQKKINKIGGFDHDLRTAEVTFKVERNGHKVEVMLTGDGVRLRAEERRPDMYEAIDCVVDKLEQQAKKHHKRAIHRSRQHSAKEVPPAFAAAVAPDLSDHASHAEPEEEEAPDAKSITRIKRFPMKPMTAQEACVEMDMMGHEFFAFRNQEGEVNVVYRRVDGTCGLIIPED
jgi:putative sigma-54 modulation protein